jgi:hypothetical protein
MGEIRLCIERRSLWNGDPFRSEWEPDSPDARARYAALLLRENKRHRGRTHWIEWRASVTMQPTRIELGRHRFTAQARSLRPAARGDGAGQCAAAAAPK